MPIHYSSLGAAARARGHAEVRRQNEAHARSVYDNLLVTCPCCGQAGFSLRGLRQHWCKAKATAEKLSAPLAVEEWQAVVNAAKAKAGI
jgi:hypothetical protein